MTSGSIILIAALFAVGGIASLMCWIVLIVRAFQESALWGLATLFFPPAGLVFVLMYWEENKRLFFVYLGSGLACGFACSQIVTAGYFTRSSATVAAKAHQGSRSPPAETKVASAPKAPPAETTGGASQETPLEKSIKQKRLELRELYDSLDSWSKRMLTKQNQLNKGNAAEVRAFNEEYAGYQAALKDYKSQCAQVEQLQAERLAETKKLGEKTAPK